jgi:putative ABC transport system ATP-binding protein
MAQPLIQMDNISKWYTMGAGMVTVLRNVNLTVDEGEFVAIMGPSGSGKSTLMNLLGALDRPSEGRYTLGGIDVGVSPDASLAHVRNYIIGFVFQGFNLLPKRTVIDNIALPLFYAGVPRAEREERAHHYLSQVGLSTHAHYFPTQLSGGQQQRVAIARALVTSPKMILADEPTGNLDSHTSKEVMGIFSELNQKGITMVLITHEHDVARYGKRLVHLKDGEILYDGEMY